MTDEKERLILFIQDNNQFLTESDLWRSIQFVLKCSDLQAQSYATTHCNLLSFYAVMYCQFLLNITYAEFFKNLLSKGLVANSGFIIADKSAIINLYKILVEMISTPIGVNYDDGFYQLKINNAHGSHFIGCYAQNNNIYICDSNTRGVGVLLESGLLDNDKPEWLVQYKKI